jgi:prepilin-type N-terminal cleavage/methylation domain-containing protein
MNGRSRPGAPGFTLVEILCVVVILGIAAGIIIPQLGSRSDLKAAAAARTLVSDIMYAQNLAISTQRKHYIQFVGQQYTLMADNAGALQAITHPVTKNTYSMTLGSSTPGLEGVTIDALDFGTGITIIGFDDLGAPFAYDGVSTTNFTAPATVTIKCGQISLLISIEPFTGEASVQ